MKKEQESRRSFLKYLLAVPAFVIASIFAFKRSEGFKVGKFKTGSLGLSEADAMCGISLNCGGGGGDCGIGLNCSGGDGKCGIGLNCSGS